MEPSARSARIVVFPFRDLSQGPGGTSLAPAFTEDLTTELTRFPSLEVLHPAISADDGSADADSEVLRAAASGAEWVLRGSLRREDQLRVNAQLVASNGGQLRWAESFDAPADDLLAVQDEIVSRVVAALAVHLDDERLQRARRRPVSGLTTHDCWLRGLECLRRGTLEADEEARSYFERAVELDPTYSRAWAGLSLSHFNEWSCQVWHLFEENAAGAFEHAQRAAELDSRDPLVHLVLGRVRVFRREFEAGKRDLERALALNPNDPDLLAHVGLMLACLGEPERALETTRRARQLNPRHADWYHAGEALALLLLRRFDEALEAGASGGNSFVDVPALRAIAALGLGDSERARREIEVFRREFELKISFGRRPETEEIIRWLHHVNPMRRDEDAQFLAESLRRAGLDAEPDDSAPVPRPQPAALPMPGNVFQREADAWTLAFAGDGALLTEVKGFYDLASLLERPHEPVHCLVLQGASGDDDQGVEILDERAKREIGQRVEELRQTIDEAESNNDIARAERARDELDALTRELSSSVGLGGRSRRMGDQAERARTAVTWRIRSAIKKIGVAHPRLGQHLKNSVKTGVFCVYEPEAEVQWRIRTAA